MFIPASFRSDDRDTLLAFLASAEAIRHNGVTVVETAGRFETSEWDDTS